MPNPPAATAAAWFHCTLCQPATGTAATARADTSKRCEVICPWIHAGDPPMHISNGSRCRDRVRFPDNVDAGMRIVVGCGQCLRRGTTVFAELRDVHDLQSRALPIKDD